MRDLKIDLTINDILTSFGKEAIMEIKSNNTILYPSNKNDIKIVNSLNNVVRDRFGYYKYNDRYYKKVVSKIKDKYDMIIYFDVTKERNDLKRRELDPLTHIYNRQRTEDAIRNYIVDNEDTFAFIIFDIDNFKSINDTYGHQMGDNILIKVASNVFKIINRDKNKDGNIIGRTGGDEFIALLKNVTEEETREVLSDILDVIQGININNERDITISIGVKYVYKKELSNLKEYFDNPYSIYDYLLSKADQSLYNVKNTGKNNYKLTLEKSN